MLPAKEHTLIDRPSPHFDRAELDRLAHILLAVAAGRRPTDEQRSQALEIFDVLFRAGALR